MDFKEQIKEYRDRINLAIDHWIPSSDRQPAQIHEAMRYSMEAGGKRLRPMLVLASAEILGAKNNPLPAAVSIECIHTYSLIHDDLPAMDDSPLRRGVETCHVRFDEATAILAGDALLTFAFELLSASYMDNPRLGMNLIRILSDASGSGKLIGGQMLDILTERGRPYGPNELQFIHENKTAALIQASLLMGGHLAEASEQNLETLANLGHHLGLAFQVIDEVLDATSTSDDLGKPAGADAENNKATATSILGIEGARASAGEHTRSALNAAQSLPGDTSFLEALIEYLENRLS